MSRMLRAREVSLLDWFALTCTSASALRRHAATEAAVRALQALGRRQGGLRTEADAVQQCQAALRVRWLTSILV